MISRIYEKVAYEILSPVRLPVPPRRHPKYRLDHWLVEWTEVDSNHRSKMQQIYSLSPLATRESAHLLGMS